MSSVCTDEESDKWLELDNVFVPTQTLDEILADQTDVLEEDLSCFDDDESIFSPFNQAQSSVSINYHLDVPILIKKDDTISHQIVNVRERPGGGVPTALAVSHLFIAIGMTRGLVLIFERRTGKLSQFIHPERDSGSIAAMDFSHDSSKLAIGMSRGALLIAMCGSTKKVKRKFEDIVQSGHGILQVKYMKSSALLVVDSGGSVYEIHERSSFKRNCRCIFAGSNGEVVNICIILSEELILLASLTQIIVLSLSRGYLISHLRLSHSNVSPPLIDYRHRAVTVIPSTVVEDTRICLARDKEIRIYQVQTTASRGVIFPLLKVFKVNEMLVNLKWIDDFHLLAMTFNEEFRLIEVHRGTTLAFLSFSHINLVYNSSDFKGLATGGNVSNAMMMLSEVVCYQSVVRSNFNSANSHQLPIFLLGQNGVYKVSLLDQVAQLDEFVARGEIASALLYVSDIYGGLICDKTPSNNLRRRISSRIPDLICQLLEFVINDGPIKGQLQKLIDHYKQNIMVLQRACVTTCHFDLLYNDVYRRLEKDSLAKSIFLDLLDEFVIEGQLDQPPPTLIHDYLSYLIVEGQFSQFENAVTKFPVDRLDIHQVITTCRQNQLFDGIAYVMNNALNDYLSPLKEMFESLQEFVNKEVLSDWEIGQGNKLLLYINCCLSGRAYPFGSLPADHLVEIVPLQTYKFLVQLRSNSSAREDSLPNFNGHEFNDDVSSVVVNGESNSYPNLRLLLKFDTAQFLNVISTCADVSIFSNGDALLGKNDRLKRLVDILVGIFESRPASQGNELGTILLPFILTLLQKNAIPKDAYLFVQLIILILESPFINLRAQFSTESYIIDLIRNVEEIDEQAILDVAMQKPYVQICTYLLMNRREFIRLLSRCITGPCDKEHVFMIIQDLLSNLRGHELEDVKTYVKSSIPRLNAIDSQRTALLVMENFLDYFSDASEIPLSLLNSCFDVGRSKGFRGISNNEELDETLFGVVFEGKINETVSSPSDVDFDEEEDTNSKVLEINCKSIDLDSRLADFLVYWLPIGSQSDFCLNLAVANGLLQCAVFLMVARRLTQHAFEYIYESLINESDSERISEKVAIFLKFAKLYSSEAKSDDWLMKVFRFILLRMKNESSIDDDVDKSERLVCEKSTSKNALIPDLVAVFTVIVEGGFSESVDEIIEELFAHSSIINSSNYGTLHELIGTFIKFDLEEYMNDIVFDCMTMEDLRKVSSFVKGERIPCSRHKISNDFCARCCQQIAKSFVLFRCGHLTDLSCAEDVSLRYCNVCAVSKIEIRRPWREKIDFGFGGGNSTKNVNMLDLIHTQVLRLGPPPKPVIYTGIYPINPFDE